jgi:hypothetical protein
MEVLTLKHKNAEYLLTGEKAIRRSYFRAAKQAGIARQIAELKAGRRLKPDKSGKQKYKPGKLGLSAVSQAIKEKYGAILSRRERRQMVGGFDGKFMPVYTGSQKP